MSENATTVPCQWWYYQYAALMNIDGKNPVCTKLSRRFVVNEAWAWHFRNLYSLLQRATRARQQPLVLLFSPFVQPFWAIYPIDRPPWSPFSALIGAFEFAITPSSRSSQHFEFENVNALYFLFLLFFVSCSYLLLSVRLFTNFSFLMKDFSLKISRRVCTFPASGPHLLD